MNISQIIPAIINLAANVIGTASASVRLLLGGATDDGVTTLQVGGNIVTANVIEGYQTISAAGVVVLTRTSPYQTYLTGSNTISITLPATTTLKVGQAFQITNLNSNNVVIHLSNGTTQFASIAPGFTTSVVCTNNASDVGASWNLVQSLPIGAGSNYRIFTSTGLALLQTSTSSPKYELELRPAGLGDALSGVIFDSGNYFLLDGVGGMKLDTSSILLGGSQTSSGTPGDGSASFANNQAIIDADGNVTATTLNANNGFTGTFLAGVQTVTVTNGIITGVA